MQRKFNWSTCSIIFRIHHIWLPWSSIFSRNRKFILLKRDLNQTQKRIENYFEDLEETRNFEKHLLSSLIEPNSSSNQARIITQAPDLLLSISNKSLAIISFFNNNTFGNTFKIICALMNRLIMANYNLL